MKMMRYFFISDELDDVESFEKELEDNGIVKPQIHVLSQDDRAVAHHQDLHPVKSLMKRDVVHSSLMGAGVGAALAAIALLIAYVAGWNESPAGWFPFVFLAIVILGFLTWQGGLWGIQSSNVAFRKFEQAIKEGQHVVFVDAPIRQQEQVQEIARHHGHLRFAAVDSGAPSWLVYSQHRLTHFFTHTFP
jgi:hypothetical protein